MSRWRPWFDLTRTIYHRSVCCPTFPSHFRSRVRIRRIVVTATGEFAVLSRSNLSIVVQTRRRESFARRIQEGQCTEIWWMWGFGLETITTSVISGSPQYLCSSGSLSCNYSLSYFIFSFCSPIHSAPFWRSSKRVTSDGVLSEELSRTAVSARPAQDYGTVLCTNTACRHETGTIHQWRSIWELLSVLRGSDDDSC